ncbi:MAG: dipeptide epimerase [Planctomycetota bacterium]|nr:dipeptide epimerase [Planctomycetota bacterium]
MKLHTAIEEIHLRHTFTISRESQDVVRVVTVELSDGDLVGFGEASPSSFYGEDAEGVQADLQLLEELAAGADPLHYRDVLEQAAEILGDRRGALCAFDTALFDLASRKLGVPLWRLLGLDPARIPLTSFTIGIDTIEQMLSKLQEARDYPILKVKLGTPQDIEIIRQLRRETDAVFRVDANCGWTVDETIEKSAELKALGVEFIEQPLPPEQLEAMEEVCRRSALPVIADENSVIPEDIPALAGRFHGINIKLVKCGGILPALRMVHLARTLGLQVMFGCMIETSILISAAAQLGPLADYLDLDGNVLIQDDPYAGVENEAGRLVLGEGRLRRR